jgi:hypothetical protein
MSYDIDPVAGGWYRHLDKDLVFRVISVDEDNDTIQLQHYDGDLEEIDSAEWFAMDLELAEEPEDWGAGPLDEDDKDGDLDDADSDARATGGPRGWDDEDEDLDEDEEDEDEEEGFDDR